MDKPRSLPPQEKEETAEEDGQGVFENPRKRGIRALSESGIHASQKTSVFFTPFKFKRSHFGSERQYVKAPGERDLSRDGLLCEKVG